MKTITRLNANGRDRTGSEKRYVCVDSGNWTASSSASFSSSKAGDDHAGRKVYVRIGSGKGAPCADPGIPRPSSPSAATAGIFCIVMPLARPGVCSFDGPPSWGADSSDGPMGTLVADSMSADAPPPTVIASICLVSEGSYSSVLEWLLLCHLSASLATFSASQSLARAVVVRRVLRAGVRAPSHLVELEDQIRGVVVEGMGEGSCTDMVTRTLRRMLRKEHPRSPASPPQCQQQMSQQSTAVAEALDDPSSDLSRFLLRGMTEENMKSMGTMGAGWYALCLEPMGERCPCRDMCLINRFRS